MIYSTRSFLAMLVIFLLFGIEEDSAIITQKEYKADLLFSYQPSGRLQIINEDLIDEEIETRKCCPTCIYIRGFGCL
ncbi:hypothetical protein D910_06490 [Dendroctonus ponderosae]|uniref:Uncharacterized protein n=1 Tax=Dendroctonus ponderosae TaxID=77166 RepID=U4U9U1_DENPD|nr:hypothetical protein D910_06490 [Dendroctonus ponderosae]